MVYTVVGVSIVAEQGCDGIRWIIVELELYPRRFLEATRIASAAK